MSSQPPPPPPPPSSSLSTSNNLLFCASEIIEHGFTTQPFATISIREMLKLREQSNVTWKDICAKSNLRHFPSESSTNKVNDNQCSNSKNNEDLPTEINKLHDDETMETDCLENNSKSKVELEVSALKEENRKLSSEKIQIVSFFEELYSCIGVSWNDNDEEQSQKDILSASNLQMCLHRLKQLLRNGEEDKMELEKLKQLEQVVSIQEKITIDRDSQTEEKATKSPDGINPPNKKRRKKGLCKVVGTNLQDYWCSCGRAFAHRDRIAAHIKINKLSWKFKCTECTLKFADLKTLKAHMETTHGIENPIEDYNRGCIFCGKMFETAEELTQHTETHKKEWVKNHKTVKAVKAKDQVAVVAKTQVVNQVGIGNKGKKLRKTMKVPVEPIKITTNRKRTLLKCRLCTRTFSDHVRFQRHATLEHKSDEG